MFGYITPVKSELRVKELARYNAYYCGVCNSINEQYGVCARAFLNYDCAFAAILLSGIGGGMEPCSSRVCAFKPLKGKINIAARSSYIDAAADLNIILAYEKLADDVLDDKRAVAYAGRALLKRPYQAAAERRKEVARYVSEGLGELHELERAACSELDAPGDVFGRMLRNCFTALCQGDKRISAPLGAVGYNLGKWIYLADAWEDREADARSGSYNVFNASGADAERAAFLMHCSINEAIAAYELLGLASNREILDNIIMMGCTAKTRALLGGVNEQSI